MGATKVPLGICVQSVGGEGGQGGWVGGGSKLLNLYHKMNLG